MPVDMKQTIASAFAQMAQEKNVDKITVKDLVERCNISRQAFYYHFQDLLEVMEWSIRQLVQHAFQNSLNASDPQKAIEAFIRISMQHGDWLMRLLSSQRREQVERIFVDAMRSSIKMLISSQKPDLAFCYQDLEVALDFYAYGTAGVLFENCKRKDLDPKTLSVQLYRLINGQLL